MKKLLSLSLVASATILSLNASAQDLSEAIKNVDVSGTVAYRYNDYSATDDNGTHQNNYKIGLNVSSQVNDDVKANTRFLIESFGMDTTDTGDANVDVKLSEVNFTYTGVNNLALTVGKQAVATPWTVDRDAMGNESTGTGAFAVYTAGPVTLAGAFFNQTNLGNVIDDEGRNLTNAQISELGAEDIYVLGASATLAGVTFDAFYADYQDQFDAYTVGLAASYKVGEVTLSPFARFSTLDPEEDGLVQAVTGTEDQELWQIGMGASMGIFNAFVAYGETDKDGGMVYFDSGAATNMDYHWRVTAQGQADAEFLYAHVDADVTDKINVGLFYSEADIAADNDEEEIYVQAKYNMSKNFSTYVRLGQYEVDTEKDQDMGRLHVQYSF